MEMNNHHENIYAEADDVVSSKCVSEKGDYHNVNEKRKFCKYHNVGLRSLYQKLKTPPKKHCLRAHVLSCQSACFAEVSAMENYSFWTVRLLKLTDNNAQLIVFAHDSSHEIELTPDYILNGLAVIHTLTPV